MATMGVGASGRGDWRVGVDLGGTQLRAAAVSADGQILSHDRRPTPGTSAADVVQAIVEALTIVEAGAATTSLASAASNPLVIAAPGPLDLATGRILDTPNLPHLRNFPLAAAVAEALHREVHLENDATLAALGEATFGAGRGFDVVLFLTISTGIGGGLVVDGRPYRGTSGQAAELGHLIIDGRRDAPRCGAGHTGCLEALASGSAIRRAAAAAGTAGGGDGPDSDVEDRGGRRPSARDVAAAARAGDPVALAILDDAARWLGLGIGSAINAFDPAVVVLGGGVMGAWDLLGGGVMLGVEEVAMSEGWRRGGIVAGALGDDAGVVGAATWRTSSGPR
jgi:glucokinase